MLNFFEILEKFSITKEATSYVLKNSTSNNAPYHNFYHVQTVAVNCYEACLFEHLNKKKTELIVLAALFHDFSHSQGKEKDSINVKVAIEAFQHWAKLNSLDEEEIEYIIKVIKATEFPYVISSEDLTISQKIIRDADLTQCLQPNWVQQIIFGLGQEMKVKPEDMVKGQKNFLFNIHPNTKWFKQKWDNEKQNVFSQLKELENLYTK